MGEITIVGPGKTRGYPYPVCKKFCATVCDFRQGWYKCMIFKSGDICVTSPYGFSANFKDYRKNSKNWDT